MLLMLMLSCHGAGQPGDEDCLPISVGFECTVWECWVVFDDGVVGYTYGGGLGDGDFAYRSAECRSPLDCCDKEAYVIRKTCPAVTLPEGSCGAS